MRIGLSEPECSILNTQESKHSIASGSSVPVISRPFQTENCDSAATVSTSTSSLLHSSSQTRFGTTTQSAPAAITSVSSGPAFFGSAAFGAPIPSTFGSTQAPAFGSGACGAPTQSTFGSTLAPSFGSATSTPSTFGSMQAPAFGSGALFAASASSTFGSRQAPVHSTFGSCASVTSTPSTFGSMQAPAFGSGATLFAAPTQSTFGSIQAPAFGSGAFSAPKPSTFGSMQTPAFGSGATLFAAPTQSTFGSIQAPAFGSAPNTFGSIQAPAFGSAPNTFGSMQTPAFGSGAFSAPTPSTFGSTPFSFGGYSLSSAPTPPRFGSMQAPVQATFGSGASTTSTSFSFGPAQDFGKTDSASQVFASNGWSHGIEQGSRYPRYAPTHDGCGIYISISASNSYPHKSHEELTWEDYKKGDKGGSFPSAHLSPISSGAQRPHETTTVSSPASGCTACGATTSSSASGYLTFNGATIPPSAATSLSGVFIPASGSCPMMFGTTPAAEGTTTPALQAYPVHGFVLLPFAAMNLLQ